MAQFMHAITYEQAGTIKNDVIDLNLFEQVVQELEKTDGDTKKLRAKSNKYRKLRVDRESNQERLSAENIDFNSAYEK